MDSMIRVYENVLSQEFCQKLIDKFETSDNKTVWNDYRKFSDTLLLENPEYWRDEIPVCLDAFTQIIEKYKNDLPWNLTFSYGRALQHDALHTWSGENRLEGQNMLLKRSKNNSLATTGIF